VGEGGDDVRKTDSVVDNVLAAAVQVRGPEIFPAFSETQGKLKRRNALP
jgi:hypothetical protein